MSRHGRATMPWGKYRGVRIKLLPDSYLSFLTTTAILKDKKWWWLKESLFAELRHRGLNVEGAAETDPQPPQPVLQTDGLRRIELAEE